MFARLAVARLDRFLCSLNALRDHLRFNRDALLHPQTLHQRFDLIAREDAHQIVFEREEEARRAGVALTTRTTTQLIINAPRLVSLCADDVQAASPDDLHML